MFLRFFTVCLLILTLFNTAIGQSKMEMQTFITEDLKKISETFLTTHNGEIWQRESNYGFTIQNCNLIITSKYSSDGKTGDAKVIIPITDISEVNLIRYERRGEFTSSSRLQIKTSSHTMKRFWNGKMINMDDSTIIGINNYSLDIGQKYRSIFREFSKYCD